MNEMVENFHQLPVTVQEALITASELSEFDFRELSQHVIRRPVSYWLPKIQDKYPIAGIEPEAFFDGVSLRQALYMVFTCDHFWEWDEDIKTYDAIVSKLNSKYGVIALPSDLTGNRTGYGLAAHLLVPFGQVSETAYDENRNPVTIVDNVRERIDRLNKENRYGTH